MLTADDSRWDLHHIVNGSEMACEGMRLKIYVDESEVSVMRKDQRVKAEKEKQKEVPG